MDRDLGKFNIGQEVWVKVEEGSNASRYINKSNLEEWMFKGEVVKSGRKYITVKYGKYKEKKFNVEDDYRNCYTMGGADYKLYLTKQDIIDEIESDKLYGQIKDNFSGWKNNNQFSLDQLKRVMNIIEEEK